MSNPQFNRSASTNLETLEKTIVTDKSQVQLIIGIPKERGYQENRIAITPQSVNLLVQRGHEVIIESGAGKESFFSDSSLAAAGAKIVFDVKQVYQAGVIVKVGPVPENEIQFLKPGQTIISAIHPASINKEYLQKFLEKKVTAIAFEYIKDAISSYPIVRSMGEIAGTASILIASEYLIDKSEGSRQLLGGITGLPPTKVVILGAGTVGEFAAKSALGLGAEVRVFDNSLSKLKRLQNNITTRIFTSIIQPSVLAYELQTADVVIGALSSEQGRTPLVVNEVMVMKMKPFSEIIDVSIDQGGCFETSEMTNHDKPTFSKYKVIHYCVPNIAPRVSKTASIVLSNIITPILLESSYNGGFESHIWTDKGIRSGVYCYKGMLTNRFLSRKFDIKHTNLELIASSQM